MPARRWSVRLWRIALVAAAGAALAPCVALGSFPGRDGVIAYTAEGSIWAVDPATGDQRRLTSGSAPALSPSGNMLAFQRGAPGSVTVYLSNADGSDARPLVAGSQPAFSPSGRQIVFVRAGGLFVTAATPGSPVQQITNHPGDREPQWSSKGSIAFERTESWHELITCLPPGLGQQEAQRLLRRGARACRNPAASHQYTGYQSELDIINPASLRVHQILTLREGTDLWPDWSPDGRTVAVSLCHALPPDEREVEPEPPRLRYVQDCWPTVWAPDGHELAVSPAGARSNFQSCPGTADYGSEYSWQPLLAGTSLVPTAPCPVTALQRAIPKSAESENAPPARAHRTRSRSHRHR